MYPFVTRAAFIVGLLIGVFLAVLLKLKTQPTKAASEGIPKLFSVAKYNRWFDETKLIRTHVSFDSLRYKKNENYVLESDYLHKKVTVLCLVLVKNVKNAAAAKETWGKHCNHLQLLNVASDRTKLPVRRNKEESSWAQLCKALTIVPEHFQWVVVVHDYTFLLVENLRFFLAGLNPDDKYYLGHAVQFWNTIYNMGQAGYVLSRGSVDAFKQHFKAAGSCFKAPTYWNKEDYYLGQNLAALNITPADTRDQNGLSTFHPYNLYHVVYTESNHSKLSTYPHKCCSPHLVAFQAIEGDKMYTYYYLLYTLQLFREGKFGNQPAVGDFPDDQIWKNFLKKRGVPENVTSQQYYQIWEDIVDDPTSFAKHMKREEFLDSM